MAKYGPRPSASYYSTKYPNTHVAGFEDVMRNLQLEILKIKGATVEGLIQGAVMVRQDTENTAPVTPLDYGNLRASWFITTADRKIPNDKWNTGFKGTKKGSEKKVNVTKLQQDHANAITEAKASLKTKKSTGMDGITFGYSAYYAIYVHENMSANFGRIIKENKKKNQPMKESGPKWFQYAVDRNKGRFLATVAQYAKIKR